MVGYKLPAFWRVTWVVIAPAVLGVSYDCTLYEQ